MDVSWILIPNAILTDITGESFLQDQVILIDILAFAKSVRNVET